MDRKVLFTTCEGGDWEGLYIDGVLIDEGHSLSVRQVLDLMGLKIMHKRVKDKIVTDLGGFPKLEADLG